MGSNQRQLMQRRWPLPVLTLSQRFAITSFAVFLLLGVVLTLILGQTVQHIALDEARQAAYDDLHAQLLTRITPDDLHAGRLTSAQYHTFDTFIRSSILSGRTIRVKVWNPDGTVVYANDAHLLGRRFPISDELAEALRGGLASEVSQLDRSENQDERRYGQLLEVYLPIQYRPGGRTFGAFEIYQTYAPVARQITSLQHALTAVLAGGLVILYVLLFGIVRRGSTTITNQQRQLRQQALHDPLTDLPNRTLLHERLEQAILTAGQTKGQVGLLLMDVDRFKEINDTFGHHYGDLLLRHIGSRLRALLRPGDMIARLGGDEFAILLPDTNEPGAAAVATQLLTAFASPFAVENHSLSVGASIGITLYPQHGTDGSVLLQRADVAMYHAKRTESGYTQYAPEYDEYSPDRLALISGLQEAIEQDELLLHFQPQLCLHHDQVMSVEALVRWHHPKRGMIPPNDFIPLAEHSGLIRSLTTWVLDRALQQCHDWRASGLDLRVAVNLSARSLHDPGLVETIACFLETWQIPPDRLELELTESALMSDPTHGAAVLGQLQDMGVRIAIDDFGTGYSSLAYLKRLPIDEIKIDRSFVQNMTQNDGDVFIIRSIVDLGHSLGLEVVAEGVEDEQCLRLLAYVGCDLAQGFHVSRPLPAGDLEAWIGAAQVTIAT